MFKELNPLLHSELRLAVMSLLISVEEADFVYIRQQTKATAGNLSVQIDKLSKAGYVEVTKTFKGKKPCTICKITPQGVDAFEEYVESLKSYLAGRLSVWVTLHLWGKDGNLLKKVSIFAFFMRRRRVCHQPFCHPHAGQNLNRL